jgi:hypothetical protein
MSSSASTAWPCMRSGNLPLATFESKLDAAYCCCPLACNDRVDRQVSVAHAFGAHEHGACIGGSNAVRSLENEDTFVEGHRRLTLEHARIWFLCLHIRTLCGSCSNKKRSWPSRCLQAPCFTVAFPLDFHFFWSERARRRPPYHSDHLAGRGDIVLNSWRGSQRKIPSSRAWQFGRNSPDLPGGAARCGTQARSCTPKLQGGR